jgi:hypothetical protein
MGLEVGSEPFFLGHDPPDGVTTRTHRTPVR